MSHTITPAKRPSANNRPPKFRQPRSLNWRTAWTTDNAHDQNTPLNKVPLRQQTICQQQSQFQDSITISSSPRPASPSQAGSSTAVVFRRAHQGQLRPQLGKALGRAGAARPRAASPPSRLRSAGRTQLLPATSRAFSTTACWAPTQTTRSPRPTGSPQAGATLGALSALPCRRHCASTPTTSTLHLTGSKAHGDLRPSSLSWAVTTSSSSRFVILPFPGKKTGADQLGLI